MRIVLYGVLSSAMTILYFTLSMDLHNTAFNVLTNVPGVKHRAGLGSRDPNSVEYSYTFEYGICEMDAENDSPGARNGRLP